MPRFVSTHLGRLLTSAPSVQQITAQVVEPRVLFPALAKTNVEECLPALAAALELTESVQEYHIQLYEQFMKGFERATTPEILSAFADYVLKLKESDFTNIFTRMLVWSRKNKDHTYRFYVIINTLWTRMESLFMPYYCRTTDLSVDVLNTCIKAKQASPVRTEVMTSLLNSFKLDQSSKYFFFGAICIPNKHFRAIFGYPAYCFHRCLIGTIGAWSRNAIIRLSGATVLIFAWYCP